MLVYNMNNSLRVSSMSRCVKYFNIFIMRNSGVNLMSEKEEGGGGGGCSVRNVYHYIAAN